jgi:hypothetical protein
VSLAEVDGHEAVIVGVEQRQARHLHGLPLPRSFEGYPVVVEIRALAGPN